MVTPAQRATEARDRVTAAKRWTDHALKGDADPTLALRAARQLLEQALSWLDIPNEAA